MSEQQTFAIIVGICAFLLFVVGCIVKCLFPTTCIKCLYCIPSNVSKCFGRIVCRPCCQNKERLLDV